MEFLTFKSRHQNITHKITLTAFMLAFVLLFQYLEQFIGLGFGYLKLNFSLLFILPIFYFNGFIWGVFLFLVRALFGLLLSGFASTSLVSKPMLLLYELIVVCFIYLYSYIFKNLKSSKHKMLIILFLSLISIMIVSTLLNMLLFFPLYISAFTNFNSPPTIANAIVAYDKINIFFFNIPSYWWGMIAVYTLGNLIKFGFIFILYWPLVKILRFYKHNYFH